MNRLHGSIILTYRCNAKCNMCGAWKYPTSPQEEIGVDVIRKLPPMFFCNITGGEPFMRRDLVEIAGILRKKSKRIVISTNAYFTDKVLDLCRKYPDIGIRISLEGLQKTNDAIRGIPGGFNKAMNTLLGLRKMGIKDIGFAMTVQDSNYMDLVSLYNLSKKLGCELATAAVHNSHYFHKTDNRINDKEKVSFELKRLTSLLLRSEKPKDWFRAYFNFGLMNFIMGNKRLLPCEMGRNGFFLDPWGDVLSCNGMDRKQAMGNLKEQSWKEIWKSEKARKIRKISETCAKNCWMIGSVAPAIWHHPVKPVIWVLKNKVKLVFGRKGKLL